MADHEEPLIPEPMRPLDTVDAPAFAVPALACDTHMHVFGPVSRYPHVPHPHYTVPPGELGHYRGLLGRLGLARFAIVQPSFYGTDNACLLDALATGGDEARAVVMIEEDLGADDLSRMHAAGVRGVRLDLFNRGRAISRLCRSRRALHPAALDWRRIRTPPDVRWCERPRVLLPEGGRGCLSRVRQPARRHGAAALERRTVRPPPDSQRPGWTRVRRC